MPTRGTPAASEATVTMLPRPRSAMAGATSRAVWNTPPAFTANSRSQAASSTAVAGPVCSTPATFTRMSTGPSSATASATAARTASGSATSRRRGRNRPGGGVPSGRAARASPARRPASAVTASPSMSVANTEAPWAYRVRTTASPMPRPAPVTNATRPANRACPGAVASGISSSRQRCFRWCGGDGARSGPPSAGGPDRPGD